LRNFVAAGPRRRVRIAVVLTIAADREAEHVQVAVVHALAAEGLERTALARIMAVMDFTVEARLRAAVRQVQGSRVEGDRSRRRQHKAKGKGGGDEEDRLGRSHAARLERRKLSP
jgi:hypothetical protein